MLNNNRLTEREDSIWECKIKECEAEEWMRRVTGISFSKWEENESICDNCPFEKYINRLSLFEDKLEQFEDDLK